MVQHEERMNITKNTLVLRGRKILRECKLDLRIPRDPKKWRDFLYSLRTIYLGYTLTEFWGSVGYVQSTGSKYENGHRGDIPRRLMLKFAEAYDLLWEVPLEEVTRLQAKEAKSADQRMLKLLKINGINEEKLFELIQDATYRGLIKPNLETKN